MKFRSKHLQKPLKQIPTSLLACCFMFTSAASHAEQIQASPQTQNTKIAEATPSPTITAGYNQLRSGDYTQALELFQQILSQDPTNLKSLLGIAIAHSEKRNHQDAYQAFDKVVQLSPENTYAWSGRGLAAFNLEDFDAALDSFKMATKDRPVNGFYYESLAWTHFCRGEFKAAAETSKIATLMYAKEGTHTSYPQLIAYFSHLELAEFDNANRALRYALKNQNRQAWPAPVLKYLSNQISKHQLISYVSDHAEETEAHVYIALKLNAIGDTTKADKHINWVSNHGDQSVFEFTLARSRRLQNSVALSITSSNSN